MRCVAGHAKGWPRVKGGEPLVAAVSLTLFFASCSAATDVTSAKLFLHYDDAWSLSELEVRIGERTGRKPAAHELRVLVPDEWNGQSLEVEVAGLRGGERYAHGQTTVTPLLGREVSVEVVLTRLPCGAWCTAGATQCEGDGTVICEQRDDDTCMEWGDVTACGGDTHCSLGACRGECIEECAEGETRCDGPGGLRTCGQADDDPCMDWLPVVACAEGETCSNGSCNATCRDECTAGQTDCLGGGVIACGDLNEDGCLEWGPPAPCGEGESCEAGACQPLDACEDQCTASMCTGLTLRQCANYDEDPCLEPSPGTSCVPEDPCMEGRCTPNGCESTPKVCMDPPDPVCVDADTRRVYRPSGACSAGSCSYAFEEESCPGCAEGVCDDVIVTDCELVAPQSGCPEGMGCYDDIDSVACVTAGDGSDGEPCDFAEDCRPGLGCLGGSRSARPLLCRRYCRDDSDCGGGVGSLCFYVHPVAGRPELCSIDCDPLTHDRCSAGTNCYLLGAGPMRLMTDCAPPGAAGAGEACDWSVDCVPGLGCVSDTCMPLCLVVDGVVGNPACSLLDACVALDAPFGHLGVCTSTL